MEECKLTKRPCREAIKESINKCKDSIAIRDMYRIVEIIRKSVDDIEFIELSKGDRIRAWFIRDIMRLKDCDVKQLWSACKGIEEDRRERKAGK